MGEPNANVLSGFLDPETAERLRFSVPPEAKRRDDVAYDREIRKAVQDDMRMSVLVDGKEQTIAQVMAHAAVAEYLKNPSVFKLNAFEQATGEASVKVELEGAADGLGDLL